MDEESGIRSRVERQRPDIVKFLVRDAGIAAIHENAVRPCVVDSADGRSAAEAWPWSIARADAVCICAWLCHGRTVRLTLAAEPFAPCEDLAEAWSVRSQLSSVVLTVLMPCIIGISDGAVRF